MHINGLDFKAGIGYICGNGRCFDMIYVVAALIIMPIMILFECAKKNK